MTTPNFNLDYLNNLVQISDVKVGFNKKGPIYESQADIEQAKDYVKSYFVPLSNSQHAMKIDNKWIIKEDVEVKKAYFNRMHDDISKWYFKGYTNVRTVAYNVNKPELYDDKLNLCPRIKWVYDDSYNGSRSDGLNFILSYIKEVLCSDKLDCFEYTLKWLANMVRGNKNNTCIYMKGPQGIGKSSLFQFLSNHVIGKDLCLETGSDPIRTKFNEILAGKLLVCIEELENFSRSEWESISSTLKRMITSNVITLQNKCTKAYESDNINNYILISNNDAIKDDDGRRYFILDLSISRIGDHEYFKQLYSHFNDQIGQEFYNFLHTVDLTNFNPQLFPITQSKLESISKRLDSVYKFLKEAYILPGKALNKSYIELYAEYGFWSDKPVTKEDFAKKMKEAGITRTKHTESGKLWYEMECSKLLKIATNKNWLTDNDEISIGVASEATPMPTTNLITRKLDTDDISDVSDDETVNTVNTNKTSKSSKTSKSTKKTVSKKSKTVCDFE